MNQMRLVVDGTDEYGNYAGDAQNAPFVVFDIERQENIAGPFPTRERAEQALEFIKRNALAMA
jgi:hypothetical protein